ncbi:unnamed protein product [Rhizoctonia solani]|uniref:Inhibitor I9 domain-containing protein n=1 Tax=Rhizoctonia solani TaxID=456999 RepID=A0A8H3I081_9AGAM|nr:unnamed protein product [Rhizoctonia solani]CAE7176654.1 unnamed protein product [Rhizoctonia solani]
MSSPVPISWTGQNAIPNKYLVRLKDDADITSHLSWLEQNHSNSDDGSSKCQVLHKYSLIKGYAAILTGSVVENLTKRGDVKSITEDRKPDPLTF